MFIPMIESASDPLATKRKAVSAAMRKNIPATAVIQFDLSDCTVCDAMRYEFKPLTHDGWCHGLVLPNSRFIGKSVVPIQF